MPRRKKSSGHCRRSSNENNRSCAGGTTKSGDLDSNQCVCCELSEHDLLYLSETVVSLALSDGHKVLFESSGITKYRSNCVAKFLTSASLVRALDNEAQYHDNVKIEVRHGGDVVTGCLAEYDLDYEIAVVEITSFLDVHTVFFHDSSKFELDCDVIAIRGDILGKLKTTKREAYFKSKPI